MVVDCNMTTYVVQVEVLGVYIDTSIPYGKKQTAENALRRFRKGHPGSSFRIKVY